jgi:hypothetical protein
MGQLFVIRCLLNDKIWFGSREKHIMVTREEVIWAYRCILGREPESEEVIEGALFHNDMGTLRYAMFSSVEFAEAMKAANLVEIISRAQK